MPVTDAWPHSGRSLFLFLVLVTTRPPAVFEFLLVHVQQPVELIGGKLEARQKRLVRGHILPELTTTAARGAVLFARTRGRADGELAELLQAVDLVYGRQRSTLEQIEEVASASVSLSDQCIGNAAPPRL